MRERVANVATSVPIAWLGLRLLRTTAACVPALYGYRSVHRADALFITRLQAAARAALRRRTDWRGRSGGGRK
jgi:hypothetical protein